MKRRAPLSHLAISLGYQLVTLIARYIQRLSAQWNSRLLEKS